MPTQDICRENSHGEAAAAQLTKWLTVPHTHSNTHTHAQIHCWSPAAFYCPHPLMHALLFFLTCCSLTCLFLVKSLLSTASNHFQNKDCGSNTIGEKTKYCPNRWLRESTWINAIVATYPFHWEFIDRFRIVKWSYSTYLWNQMEKYIL